MRETEPTRDGLAWKRLTNSISAKLVGLLLAAMAVIFCLLGYSNIRLHRKDLEASTLSAAEHISDVIVRSTDDYMMRNDRDGLYHAIKAIADEPGMAKIRILNPQGEIAFSTDSAEVNHVLDKSAEACYGCHAQSKPLTRLNRPDRFRIYRNAGGQRILGIITPIENKADCSNATCHAHPVEQQILGVLDTNISLEGADARVAASSAHMLYYTIGAMLLISVVSCIFVWRVVGLPIRALKQGTDYLSRRELGYQIPVSSHDELGELAHSFNGMSLQLRAAHEEIVQWAMTLEHRVEQKTQELKRAHDHVLHVEKMASIGKMAAVVAHEVNNPLSGILTYAKLLRKWIGAGQVEKEKRDEAVQCLDLIASESRRCGDLIKNLLTLSRPTPMNLQTTDINSVVEKTLMLVRPQLDATGIELQLSLDKDLPPVQCDPAQIEQVLIALTINAKDAMPHGGSLWLETRMSSDGHEFEIKVRDDGTGIPPDVLAHIFEPFLTTKESGHGVGLGLAIARGIIERHDGRITVESEVGKGTTFVIYLPARVPATSVAGATGDTAKEMR